MSAKKLLLVLAAICSFVGQTQAGSVDVVVLDGGVDRPVGVRGAAVALEETAHSTTTDVLGEASLASVSSGRYVLRVTPTGSHAPLRVAVEVPADGTVTVGPLLLPRVPTGAGVAVTTSGGVVTATTQVESALVPDARLTVASGTTITGATSPTLALFPVDRAHTPAPFAPGLEPIRLYAISPAGVGFSTGQHLRLPNDEGLAPGTQVPVYGLLPREDETGTGWVELGTATVEDGGDYLESDTAFVRSATLLAVDGPLALPTRHTLELEDRNGDPISGASVSVHGIALVESATAPGTYTSVVAEVVNPRAPVRAVVRKDVGSGLALAALTDPVQVEGGETALHRGAPLILELQAEDCLAVALALTRNVLTDHSTHLLTEAGVAAHGSDGWGGEVGGHTAFDGPLHLTFVQSGAPLVDFDDGPQGMSSTPDEAQVLGFTLTLRDPAFDPDASTPYTSTARVTSAEFSLDGGSTWHDAELLDGDARGPSTAPPGGRRLGFRWDLWATPAPGGIDPGANEVTLRATVLDAPSGHERTAETTFHYEWPAATVLRTAPPRGATGVWRDEELLVDFAHAMDAATITTATITLAEDGVGTIATTTVTWLADTNQARVTVSSDLPASTLLALTVTTGAQNAFGLPASAAYVTTFTTGALAGLADQDGDGLLNVEEDAFGTDSEEADSDDDGLDDDEELYVTFTDPTNDDTDGDGTEDGPDTAPLGTPEAPLEVGTALVATFLVVSASPISTSVDVNACFTVVFTNPIDASSVTSGNITLHDGSSYVNLALLAQPHPRALLLDPTSSLAPLTTYTLVVGDGFDALEDTDGTDLETTRSFELFTDGSSAPPTFEARHYLTNLAGAAPTWQSFPLTAAAAGGRAGGATVIPATHKLLLTETDFAVPGRGLVPVDVTRIYRNNETADVNSGGFGNHWFLPWDRGFEAIATVDTDATVDLRHRSADGRVFDYKSASGRGTSYPADYLCPPGFHDTFHVETEGGVAYLVQRERVGGLKHFYRFWRGTSAVSDLTALEEGDVGVLCMVRDRNLNTVVIERHPVDDEHRPLRIDTITSDLEHVTRFVYGEDDDPDQDLVLSVKQLDAEGVSVARAWAYEYDEDRNLTGVSTPAVQHVAGGSLVTAAKVHTYAYSEQSGAHLLSSVTDGRGETTLRVFYDAQGDVSQVDHGAGAGEGTTFYTWTLSAGVTTATQIDPVADIVDVVHEAYRTPGFHNVASSSVYTRGIHPGQAAKLTTTCMCDSDGRWIEYVTPDGRQFWAIRGTACGCPYQEGTGGSAVFCVRNRTFEPKFKGCITCSEATAYDRGTIGGRYTNEYGEFSVADQVKYNIHLHSGEKRDACTRFFYYDHEDMAARVAADRAYIFFDSAEYSGSGGTALPPAWFTSAVPPVTFGDDLSGDLHVPDPSVFATDPGGWPVRGGNLIAVRGARPQVVDPTTGTELLEDRQVIESFVSYNQFGQPVFTVAPDGTWTRQQWHIDGPMKGRLASVEVDTNWRVTRDSTDLDEFDLADGAPETGETPELANRLALVTTFEWDLFGRVTKTTDPRGGAFSIEYDLIDQISRTVAAAPFDYERQYRYDASNQLVLERVQNVVPVDRNDDGVQTGADEQRLGGRAWFEHSREYDSSGRLVREERDASDDLVERTLVTTFQYDARGRLVGVRKPEGNTDWLHLDERGQVHEVISGASDGTTQRRTRFLRDDGGFVAKVFDDDGNDDPALQLSYVHYLAGTRVDTSVDELGAQIYQVYDVEGRMIQRSVKGQGRSRADDPTIEFLVQDSFVYDSADRLLVAGRLLFDVEDEHVPLSALGLDRPSWGAGLDLGDDTVQAAHSYDPSGNLVALLDDNGHRRTFEFDALQRLVLETDPLGSTRAIAYDACSNPIRITETELDSSGGAAGTYQTELFYDALQRPIARVSPLGHVERMLYDSRGLVTQVSDAMGPMLGATLSDLPGSSEHGTFPQGGSLAINGRGNTTRFQYDGLGRLWSTMRDLRHDGTGGSVVTGEQITRTVWDGNSRVLGRVDPNGNFTAYAYDHQDRPIRELFADGTQRRMTWNRSGTLAVEVDPRGVTKSWTYDAMERPIQRSVQNAPQGAGQTLFTAYDFDGLGRRTVAEDDDSKVETFYDSLDRVIKEVQTVETGAPRASIEAEFSGAEVVGTVLRASDGVGNLIKQTYPSEAEFERRYDDLDRLETLYQGWDTGTKVATFAHAGMGGRRTQRDYWSGGSAVQRQTLAYDLERRVRSLESYVISGSARIRGFGYAWDRAGHRRWERRLSGSLHDPETGSGDHYRYDSLYRLVHHDREVSDGNLDLVDNDETTVPLVPVNAAYAADFQLDAASNRRQTVIDGVSTGYALDTGGGTNDLLLNQYSRIGSAVRGHDRAGNLVSQSDTGRTQFFDADDRLVQLREGGKDVRYRYDPDGRRVLKQDVGSPGTDATLFFWDGWQTVEETDASGTLVKQYVYGEGLDEVVRANLPDAADVDGDTNFTEKVDLFFHHNSLGSIVAVTDAAGTVKESYRYSAFGQPTIFNASGVEVASSAVKQPFMFTGARWDEESGLYQMRLRYYDPVAGRFVSRDPLGLWGDAAQNGNGQGYCSGDPVNFTDPLGLGNWLTDALGVSESDDPRVGVIEGVGNILSGVGKGLSLLGGRVANTVHNLLEGEGAAAGSEALGLVEDLVEGYVGNIANAGTNLGQGIGHALAEDEVSADTARELFEGGAQAIFALLATPTRFTRGTPTRVRADAGAKPCPAAAPGLAPPTAGPRVTTPRGPRSILTVGLHPLEALLTYARKVVPKRGVRDVIVHGNEASFMAWMGGAWLPLQVAALGDILLAAGVKGNIRLISCFAGASGMARALADYMKSKGWKGTIESPTKSGWVDDAGTVGVDKGGQWVTETR